MTLLSLCHADDALSAEDCCRAIYLSEVAGPHLDGAILWGSEDVMLSNDTSDASAVDLHRHTTHSLTATDHQQTTTPPPTSCLWPSAGNGTINNTTANTVLLKSLTWACGLFACTHTWGSLVHSLIWRTSKISTTTKSFQDALSRQLPKTSSRLGSSALVVAVALHYSPGKVH